MELFECKGLRARLSPAACRANRTRPVSSSLATIATRPPACRACVQWKEIDPPLPEAVDPAEQALAETLATLWQDIDEGRLGIKHVLSAYNRRAPAELRKRRSQQMSDWLRMLGLRVVEGESFRDVKGLRCLLVDGATEAFVRGLGFAPLQDGREIAAVDRLLEVVGLDQARSGSAVEGADDPPGEAAIGPEHGPASSTGGAPGAPCSRCRYFRPLATYYDGIEGVRLCWARQTAWDFTCFAQRAEEHHEARVDS
ncbi:MAG: hypothetical protein AAGU21_01115 [Solidesulfovibrio sp.]|uniref:hypothetical protein n=1 Tax=Solidesulfovibrio sp. TaxID=2910990 RepID=UPI002B1EE667|nr:hypothetical protein [Solidesulfovibrio sp.]MEA4857921.1 hypothetical protein [Solidesulfovibrio sp.]